MKREMIVNVELPLIKHQSFLLFLEASQLHSWDGCCVIVFGKMTIYHYEVNVYIPVYMYIVCGECVHVYM